MRYLAALAALILSSCSHQYIALSDEPDFWTVGSYSSSNARDDTLYYCRSFKGEGTAVPKCYRANFYVWPQDMATPKETPVQKSSVQSIPY